MEDTREIYQGTRDILATMEEMLNHIPTQLDELRLEESFKLLIDFTEGVRSVEETTSKTLLSTANPDGNKLSQSLNVVLEAYEAGNITRITEAVQNRLLSDFANWKLQLEKLIQQ